MKPKCFSRCHHILAAAALCVSALTASPLQVSAQNMADYTNYPVFLNQTVPPNILFLVDMGDATLEAAYNGSTYNSSTSTHRYPLSFLTGTPTAGLYASNVTLTSASGDSLVAVTTAGTVINTSGVTSPADLFVSSQTYYGMFNPLRCYSTNSTSFIYGSAKTNLTDACGASYWDGNFLNWLTMRKVETISQVLIGGRPIPANSNSDGTANTLSGIQKTGQNGSTNTCASNSKSCWRYVKYVPSATLTGRVPTSLPSPTVNVSGGTTVTSGRFFGSGEGTIYVNDDATASPFDNAPAKRYNIQVDLTTEPNVPPASGSASNCFVGDPNYAGATVCYQRQWSWGLFQTMNTSNMHVAVMFVNASTGQGGSLQFPFDGNLNSSAYTNIRNTADQSFTPMSEGLYESLCYYAKSQGPCYSNSGSWSTGYTSGGLNASGDPFFFVSMNQQVRCCKSFVLMITPGVTSADGGAPDLQQPFGNLFSSSASNIGIVSSAANGDRLDDIAYYGRTHDLRSDLAGSQYVSFYAVNAMGGAAGATLLASAAKYGGFQDLNGDNAVALAGTQACTYPAGSNLGTGSSTSNPEWDVDKDCVPDTFFDASDGGGLQAQIQNAINAILKQAASGTSISVLASSSSGDGTIYQAFFYPQTPGQNNNNVNWIGYLQGLWVDSFGNMREDKGSGGQPDGNLVYKDDDIIQTRLDPITNTVLVDCFQDLNEDGKPDTVNPYQTIQLNQVQGLWEAGKKLAQRNLTSDPRNILAWVDGPGLNGNNTPDGKVTSDEVIPFNTANASTFTNFLRANGTTYTASNIISFLHGNQITNMRDRQIQVDGSYTTWRLGDIVHSTPTIVGSPQERFDVLYGDQSYQQYLQRWQTRRRVAYVGANDGMLHAFNAGFYHRAGDPACPAGAHGCYTTAASDNNSGPPLGKELWGFVPYYLLPQLMWFTMPEYTHVSYVDLKPKATDVHLWGTGETACGTSASPTPTASGCIHAGGWGTILVVGLRFGGSCGSCVGVSGTNGGGPALSVTAKFDGTNSTTRTFYSGYIVLDITNPEVDPIPLTAYSDSTLGLTTSYPTVTRMSPSDSTVTKTDHTNAVFSMVLGSGVQGYDGRATAGSSLFVVSLGQQGTAPTATLMPIGLSSYGSFMGDPITFDRDLDFRSDAVYVGRSIDPNAGAPSNVGYWWGKYYRLTMGACTLSSLPCSASTWGVANGATRSPTEMIAQLTVGGSTAYLGAITTSSSVTLDNAGNTWTFFGTGRFFSAGDKTDQHAQYLVGVKDSVFSATPCAQTNTTNCQNQNLLDVSSAQICVSCTSGNQVQGVGSTTTFADLTTKIQGNGSSIPAMDGWFIKLATNAGSNPVLGAERSIVNSSLIGGAVFFPTFIPTADICVSTGTSNLYGLYYLTGTGYTDPIFGVNSAGQAVTKVGLGDGLASSVAIQIGAQPTGMAGFVQSSNSSIQKVAPKPPSTLWSQYISWMSHRD